MDALRRDDLMRARRTPLEVRAAQALELMAAGIRMKRAQLERRYPHDTAEAISGRLLRWMARDEEHG